jgi:Skp family chaperone for outer membrane proteins
MSVRRKLGTVFVVMALVLALAPAPGLAQGSKFATVDMARVLREYEEVKRIAAQLQSTKDQYQEQIDKKQQEVKQINSDLQNAKDPAEKKRLENLKRQKLTALQNTFQKLKEQLAERERDQFDAIKEQIYAEIDKLAQAKGVAMILEKQWVYHPRRIEDLTDDLLKSLESTAGSPSKRGPSRKAAPATRRTEEPSDGE